MIVVLLAATAAAVRRLRPFGAGGEATAGSPATGAGRSPAPETSATATSAAASPTASPTAAPAPASVKITAGGDVIGGFGVSGVVDSLGSELFAGVAPYFEGSDHGFVNLESPLTTGGEAQGWKDVVIKGNPGLAPAMAASGIDVVTMANNHAGDLGDSGLLDSIKHCRKNGIAVVGAGKDLKTALAGTVLEAESGTRTAFLGFTDVLPAGYPATSASPGVAPGRADLSAVKRAIKAAAQEGRLRGRGLALELRVQASPQRPRVERGQGRHRRRRRRRVRAPPPPPRRGRGYHGGLICYSLGNLVFSGFSGETAQTVLVRVKVTPERIDALLVPVQISSSGVPTVATGSTAASILERVRSLSADLGTTVTISDGRATCTSGADVTAPGLPHDFQPMTLVVCPNLAVDRVLSAPPLRPGGMTRCCALLQQAGGKGANVARALRAPGRRPRASSLGFAAGHSGRLFAELASVEGLARRPVACAGEVRLSTAVLGTTAP